MPAQQKLFIIAWSAVVVVCIGLMVLLYVSLLPHFSDIGNVAFWVLVIFLGCGCALGVNWTWNRIKINNAEAYNAQLRKGLITHGELAYHVFEVPMPPERIYDASAKHIAAGVPRMLPAPPDEKPVIAMPDETIIEMYRGGSTLMDIVKAAEKIGAGDDVKYNRVQRVVAQAKSDGKIAY